MSCYLQQSLFHHDCAYDDMVTFGKHQGWGLVARGINQEGVCVLSSSIVSDSLQPHWTAVHQAPLFMGFSRKEYRSGLPFPTPGNQLGTEAWNFQPPPLTSQGELGAGG